MSRFLTGPGRGLLALGLMATVLAVPRAAAQTPAQIQAAVDAAYAKYKNVNDGAVADYIPALAKVDPKLFGIAVVTGGLVSRKPPAEPPGGQIRPRRD